MKINPKETEPEINMFLKKIFKVKDNAENKKKIKGVSWVKFAWVKESG